MNFVKQIFCFLALILSSHLLAQEVIHDFSGKYLNANKLISSNIGDSDETPIDVMYHYMVPEYEENADPARTPTIEVYFGELYQNDRTDQTLGWLKRQLLDDVETHEDFKLEVNLISKYGSSLKGNRKAQNFLEKIKVPNLKVNYEEIPEDINFKETPELTSSFYHLEKQERSPAAAVNQRVFWTLVRIVTGAGATTASLYYTQDMSLGAALAIGIWPGIASGAITYYSGSYGSWLSNGKWSKWMLETKNSFTTKLKKAFKLDEASLARLGKEKLARTMGKLHSGEEYLKWYITEVAFTSSAIKVPQAIGGVGVTAGFFTAASDVMIGSTMGMLAQGPGDIAIQIRKYQKVAELKEKVLNGLVKVENEKILLQEIDSILAKTTNITDTSHIALRRIENWARSRATMLSFFSVMGVGMEIAGIPLSRPILLSIGVGGAFYYGKVQGAFTQKTKVGKALQKFIKPFQEGFNKTKTVIVRTCNNIYRKRAH